MACIYKIINLINDKVYIGKTLDTIEARWKEHCNDCKRPRCEKRPLYAAMKKYGIENFMCELIEECTIEEINDREIYWIEYYNSYHNGYNATRGGDGRPYVDYELICELFAKGKTNKEIHNITGYDVGTITKTLRNNGISELERKQRGIDSQKVPIAMIDKDTDEVLKIFPSAREAANYVGEQNSSHIAAVCKGNRQTAKGYKWQYVN